MIPDTIKALLEQYDIPVKSVEEVPNTHWYQVWLKTRYVKKHIVAALKKSDFEHVGGGKYRGKPLAIIAVKQEVQP